ncbi:MAG: hypothetical protein HY774_21460 [Acidobacteria bacterium]|nr:hypothetical protein [Acidobacteriota bacterium]
MNQYTKTNFHNTARIPTLFRRRRTEHGQGHGLLLTVAFLFLIFCGIFCSMLQLLTVHNVQTTRQESQRLQIKSFARATLPDLQAATEAYVVKLTAGMQEILDRTALAGGTKAPALNAQQLTTYCERYFPRYFPLEMRCSTLMKDAPPEVAREWARVYGTALMKIDLDGVRNGADPGVGLPGGGLVVQLTVTVPYKIEIAAKDLPPDTGAMAILGSVWRPGTFQLSGQSSPAKAKEKPEDQKDTAPIWLVPSYERAFQMRVLVQFRPPTIPPEEWNARIVGLNVDPCGSWSPQCASLNLLTNPPTCTAYELTNSCGGTVNGLFTSAGAAGNAANILNSPGQGAPREFQNYLTGLANLGQFVPVSSINTAGPFSFDPNNGYGEFVELGSFGQSTGSSEGPMDRLGVPKNSNVRKVKIQFDQLNPLLPERFYYEAE